MTDYSQVDILGARREKGPPFGAFGVYLHGHVRHTTPPSRNLKPETGKHTDSLERFGARVVEMVLTH